MRYHNVEGATAVEYGLMVAFIAVAILATVIVLGNNTCSSFKVAADGMGSTPADTCK